jgi:lysophospholipase L1-like esterase
MAHFSHIVSKVLTCKIKCPIKQSFNQLALGNRYSIQFLIMKQVLVYADSLSWGIVPMTRNRLAFNQRWPGVLEIALRKQGLDVRVIEDCLNGRRTMYEDPIKEGRNGLVGLQQRIEVNSPLALVILMLGTNDFQINHPHNANHAALGLRTLIDCIRTTPLEPGMMVPAVLVIAPPAIRTPKGDIAMKFKGAEVKSIGLAQAYKAVCDELCCSFFDAGEVTSSSEVDGVHLDADQHHILGVSLVSRVQALI